jgi:hypothetical protein
MIMTLRQSNNLPNGKVQITETEIAEKGEKQVQERIHHFLYIKGIVHKEFVLAGQTVNILYY